VADHTLYGHGQGLTGFSYTVGEARP